MLLSFAVAIRVYIAAARWVNEQAALLRAGKLSAADIEHIAVAAQKAVLVTTCNHPGQNVSFMISSNDHGQAAGNVPFGNPVSPTARGTALL